MGLEIERKWVVSGSDYLSFIGKVKPTIQVIDLIAQGYLSSGGGNTVRVRIINEKFAELCIKQDVSEYTRKEYEYDIPLKDATELISSVASLIKSRVILGGEYEGLTIDAFRGDLEGLWLCEKEFDSEEEAKAFTPPDWCVEDVTESGEYSNSKLVTKRYEGGNLVDK